MWWRLLPNALELAGALVKMVPTIAYDPQRWWEITLQQPKSRMLNPRWLYRSSVSNKVLLVCGPKNWKKNKGNQFWKRYLHHINSHKLVPTIYGRQCVVARPCSSRAWWPQLAPNFCSWVTKQSQFFHTNHMLGTLDFTVPGRWAPLNFS